MSGRWLKEKLARGETVHGTFFQYLTSPAVVDVLPDEGLDFVVVSAEHNTLDLAEFEPVLYALRAKRIACLARIHSRQPDDVSRVCDTFDGVVIPYLEDIEEAKRLAAAAVYRPLKGAALERLIRTGQWPSEKTRDYIAQKCRWTVLAPMIESVQAVENLDELCRIPGIDAVFVGPNDMTVTQGIPDERDHPEFIAILQRIIDTAARHRIAAGAHFATLEQALRTVRHGARFVPFGADLTFLRDGIRQSLEALRGVAKV